MASPPPYPQQGPGAPYPGAQPYYAVYPPGAYPVGQPACGYGGYPQYGYQPYPPGYTGGHRHAVYIVEDRRRDDTMLTTCLQACCAALCCCCLLDMMTPDCH